MHAWKSNPHHHIILMASIYDIQIIGKSRFEHSARAHSASAAGLPWRPHRRFFTARLGLDGIPTLRGRDSRLESVRATHPPRSAGRRGSLPMFESTLDAQRPGNRGILCETRRDSASTDTRAIPAYPRPPIALPRRFRIRTCTGAPAAVWVFPTGLAAEWKGGTSNLACAHLPTPPADGTVIKPSCLPRPPGVLRDIDYHGRMRRCQCTWLFAASYAV